MDKVLLFQSNEGATTAWHIVDGSDASQDDAYLKLFRHVDGLQFDVVPLAGEQLREMARRGNADFARAFLALHKRNIPGIFMEVPLEASRFTKPRVVVKVPNPFINEEVI